VHIARRISVSLSSRESVSRVEGGGEGGGGEAKEEEYCDRSS
jgi:hypothetical protein